MAEAEEGEEVTCQAVQERKMLTTQLRYAAVPHVAKEDLIEGTEEELITAFSVLQGIVNEYHDGGDQMVDNCTCGRHIA